ncbi:MAG: hypothetical protein MUO72_18820, partial [Bacteroidales bacterium]|nr:hypothetical protein [Bacteroidales bacterium]
MKHFLHHIKNLLQFSLLLYALTGISNYGFGQAAGDYRTAATGNWNAIATWETYNGTAWVAASSTPTSANGVITILNGHTVTVTASNTVDQVIIDAGGQVTVNAGQTLTIANGTGTDMTVNGTLVNSGTITTTGTLAFGAGSTYQHTRDGGTIPTATWNTASNCNITGVTNTIPTGFNRTFGNFTWNCTGHVGNLYMESNITIAGNFTVSGTGTPIDPNTQSLRMSNTGAGYTMTVTGNVLIDNNATFKMNNSTGSCTMNVGGNFTLNSGNFTIVTGAANSTLSVTGDVSILGGTLGMHEDASATVGTLNVGRNFTLSGGTITETSSGTGAINFNRTGTQTYLKTGGTISNTINFTVNSGSTLDVGTSLIDGSSGTFTLSSGAGIITAHAQGLSSTAGTGSIQVTGTKTFSSGANYTYNGTSSQVTGNGLTGANNLIISNNTGVALTSSTTIAGTLTLTAGALSIGANTLTLNGPTIAGTPANLVTTATSSLIFGGTTAGVLIPTSVVALNGLSITNTSIVTLQSALTVSGTFNPAGAGLSIGANTLTLNGQINCGTLAGGATSNIIIGGAGTANLSAVTLN